MSRPTSSVPNPRSPSSRYGSLAARIGRPSRRLLPPRAVPSPVAAPALPRTARHRPRCGRNAGGAASYSHLGTTPTTSPGTIPNHQDYESSSVMLPCLDIRVSNRPNSSRGNVFEFRRAWYTRVFPPTNHCTCSGDGTVRMQSGGSKPSDKSSKYLAVPKDSATIYIHIIF